MRPGVVVGGHIFMRKHPFPCESISKVGDHYQHNGLADGYSCCTSLLALEDHSRWPRSEGGWSRVTVVGSRPGYPVTQQLQTPPQPDQRDLCGHADLNLGGRAVPLLGAALQKPFREYLEAQKAKLHHRTGEGIPTEENWLSWLFEKVVVIMVCFFVCSIVNSMAQSYAKRKQQEKYSEDKTE
ncbi:hypothetical protein INR49_015044 [Caranx melampygus]|nr:hypothetical protein INR49_015044 [Caranx melampygus]